MSDKELEALFADVELDPTMTTSKALAILMDEDEPMTDELAIMLLSE